MRIETHLDGLGAMLKKRELQPGGKVMRMVTVECARHMDKYVPMNTGVLKNTRIIDKNTVTYNVPYARAMYYGKVMVDPATRAAGFLTDQGWRSRKGVRKVASNREYQYQYAPARGKLWDRRMWKRHKLDVLAVAARISGGKAK